MPRAGGGAARGRGARQERICGSGGEAVGGGGGGKTRRRVYGRGRHVDNYINMK